MKGKTIVSDYVTRHEDRADFKHSSGYAKAQSGDNFGAASLASFEARKALDAQRKFVRKYKESKIGTGRFAEIKPKVYKREEDIIRRAPEKESKIDQKRTPGKAPEKDASHPRGFML